MGSANAGCELKQYLFKGSFMRTFLFACFFQGSLSLLEAEPRRSVWGPEHQPNPRGHHRPNKHRDLKDRKARAAKVAKKNLSMSV